MANENLRLRKRNFAVYQGYFFTFDDDQDNLLQKTDDGNTAFSYPLDTLMSYPALNAEFDGVYFWSMVDPTGLNMTIYRWKIDNYICKRQQTFTFTGGGSHSYDSRAFSVSHYHDTLASGITASGTTIYMNTYGSSDLRNFTTTSGVKLTLHLGPNSTGYEEDVIVNTTISGGVTIASGTLYGYAQNDPLHFYTYIWMFNNYNGTDSSTGALYKFDAYTGDYITKYAGGAYKDIDAATFYRVSSFASYGTVDTLCFVKGTNTLFVNIDSPTLAYYGSMVMSNVQSDLATVITVYDLTMDSQNVYRLQLKPDGTATTWTYYSYLLSSLNSFVTSISLAAYPAVIAANTVSTASLIAIVKDQFLQPVTARLVTFSDDDTVGYVTYTGAPGGGVTDTTDSTGAAHMYYRSGNTAREVRITAVAEQT